MGKLLMGKDATKHPKQASINHRFYKKMFYVLSSLLAISIVCNIYLSVIVSHIHNNLK